MKPLFFFALTFTALSVNAQKAERCSTVPYQQEMIRLFPNAAKGFQKAEENAQSWLKEHKVSKKTQTVVSLPVVVHVVYNPSIPAQNISDSVIIAQINKLTEDYRRLNADAINTRAVFDSISADVEINFCLASVDPNGNTTNGITRTTTNKATFDPSGFTSGVAFDDVKYDSTGGINSWPSSDYINIWVCNMSNSFFGPMVLGYASLPGAPILDGLVIHYEVFNTNTQLVSSGLTIEIRGRTLVHEMGHFFGLRHIWGDEGDLFGNPGNCDSVDYVYDTPEANQKSDFDCDLMRNSCSNEDVYWGSVNPPDMIENYMDYSSETCMNAFTLGQKERIWSFLNTVRAPLLNSTKCDGLTLVTELSTQKINVFPNPTSHNITIDFMGDFKPKNILLLNELGTVVKSINTSNSVEKIDVSGLKAGVYFLKVNERIQKIFIY